MCQIQLKEAELDEQQKEADRDGSKTHGLVILRAPFPLPVCLLLSNLP